jgi:hypothetical protein
MIFSFCLLNLCSLDIFPDKLGPFDPSGSRDLALMAGLRISGKGPALLRFVSRAFPLPFLNCNWLVTSPETLKPDDPSGSRDLALVAVLRLVGKGEACLRHVSRTFSLPLLAGNVFFTSPEKQKPEDPTGSRDLA